MSDLRFKVGDLAVDEDGFVHGPLRAESSNSGLLWVHYMRWYPDGAPARYSNSEIRIPRLISLYPPPGAQSAATDPDELIVIRRSRDVAAEHLAELDQLMAWAKGFCAGDADRLNHPPGLRALNDLVFCLRDELKRTASDV